MSFEPATGVPAAPLGAIGTPLSRVDGPAKVTGDARYAAEYNIPGLVHGVVVSSTIAKGRILEIDTSDALAVPGVLKVITHRNRSRTAWLTFRYRDDVAPPGSPFRALYDDVIVYRGQPVALVLAECFESARYAASLVRLEYAVHPHVTDLEQVRDAAYEPPRKRNGMDVAEPRGDALHAYESALHRVRAEYATPVEHHNPMEPHASTVIREDDGSLTIHDKIQGPLNSQKYISGVFGMPASDVRVLCPYVGGAFGSGLRPQYQLFLAVLAARDLKRSVRVSLTRQQMFTFGYRPQTFQTVSIASDANGKFQALMHDAVAVTSRFEDYQENVVNWGGVLYDTPNTRFDYKLAQVDAYTPIDMRAPGAAIGSFALESAVDELSYRVGMDPLTLRLRNDAPRDLNEDKEFSSKGLRRAFDQGAARFGWWRRKSTPRSMREGDDLIGWGVAAGVWEAYRMKASARAVLSLDGRLDVSSATADIGTGTFTILTQIASEALGLPVEKVTAHVGDSSLPAAPIEGGSWTAASVGCAVNDACQAVAKKVFRLAAKLNASPLADATFSDVRFADSRILLKADPSRFVDIAQALTLADEPIEEEVSSGPGLMSSMWYARFTHSAVFAEVKVDAELGIVRVTRIVSAVAAGRIVNPKTARSQIMGGVVWGLGMALHEETVTDAVYGGPINHNLAEYHVPVNADVQDIDVIFVEEEDRIVNPLGIKGVGEIGIVGTAAAIANAVFHATGVRVRDLPITPDKVLAGLRHG